VGMEADFAIIDPLSTPLIRHRMAYANNVIEQLFIQMILGDDRAIAATYVDGKRVYSQAA